jgi:protein AroM
MHPTRLGLLTIGQSPRRDGLARDVRAALGADFEVLERGALDGLEHEQIEAFAPTEGDYRLVTLLRDGTPVEIAKRHIVPRLQAQITALEAEGASATLLLCTGTFPPFRHQRPLLAPQEALYGIVRALATGGRIGALTPLPGQLAQAHQKWHDMGLSDAVVEAANPYAPEPLEQITEASRRVRVRGASVLFMDCFGYDLTMRSAAEEAFGGTVLLARTMAARIAADLAPISSVAGVP